MDLKNKTKQNLKKLLNYILSYLQDFVMIQLMYKTQHLPYMVAISVNAHDKHFLKFFRVVIFIECHID